MKEHVLTGRKRISRRAGALGLVAAGAVAGGVLAATITASAADNSTTTPQSSSGYTMPMAGRNGPHGPGPMGGASPVRSDEKSLSASDAAKVRAAALKAVPNGTVFRVETDAGDGVYEAHMTKSDGTPVTVKLDKNFTVTEVETGMGTGDPRPANAGSGQPSGSGAAA
jgi:hypothetical protein